MTKPFTRQRRKEIQVRIERTGLCFSGRNAYVHGRTVRDDDDVPRPPGFKIPDGLK